jgi:hypothetical protein
MLGSTPEKCMNLVGALSDTGFGSSPYSKKIQQSGSEDVICNNLPANQIKLDFDHVWIFLSTFTRRKLSTS